MSRKALLKKRPKAIDIEGEKVWVRSLTLGEALKFDELAKTDAAGSMRFLASRACLENEAGEQSFGSENDPALDEISTDVLRAIGEKVTKLSASGTAASAEKN